MPKDKQNFQTKELGDLTLREFVKVCKDNETCENCMLTEYGIPCGFVSYLENLEETEKLKKKVRVPYAKIH